MSTSASDDADDDLEDDTDDDDKTAFKTGGRVNFVMADAKGKKRVCGEVVVIDDEPLFPKNMYNEKVPTFLLSYL